MTEGKSKIESIFEKVEYRSEKGELDWQQHGSRGFKLNLGGLWLRISPVNFEIYDENDRIVESEDARERGSLSGRIGSLFDTVYRRFHGIDDKLDEVDRLLGDSPPRPAKTEDDKSSDDDLPF